MNKCSAATRGMNHRLSAMFMAVVFVGLLVAPSALFAAQGGGAEGPEDQVCGFLGNINNLLNLASVIVVAIAVVFAGLQTAFFHKRLSDVAPILIGGLLIGAAAQIANMLIDRDACSTPSASMQTDQRQ